MSGYKLLEKFAQEVATQRYPVPGDYLQHHGFAETLHSDMAEAARAGNLKAFCPRRGVYWMPPAHERAIFAQVADVDAWLKAQGYPWRIAQADEPTQAAPAKGEPSGLPDDPMKKRAALLEWFRAEDGKRQGESGKKGKRGALQRVVEKSGIDKDSLGEMLDKAIEEKRGADLFAQLTANR